MNDHVINLFSTSHSASSMLQTHHDHHWQPIPCPSLNLRCGHNDARSPITYAANRAMGSLTKRPLGLDNTRIYGTRAPSSVRTLSITRRGKHWDEVHPLGMFHLIPNMHKPSPNPSILMFNVFRTETIQTRDLGGGRYTPRTAQGTQ